LLRSIQDNFHNLKAQEQVQTMVDAGRTVAADARTQLIGDPGKKVTFSLAFVIVSILSRCLAAQVPVP
jgi:hypothetical protein